MNKTENYYEQTDFSSLLKTGKGRKIGINPKRITLNISEKIYDEANELDSYMKMGYQNVLKTAMTLGLTELFQNISKHTVNKKNPASMPSWHGKTSSVARKNHAERRATAKAMP